ncbi:zinc finger protein [Tanacetum coccineum]
MQQPDPTQGAAGILQGTCTCKELKGKSVINDASSTRVAAKNQGKTFSNRWKMVRGSHSSSSFNNRTSDEKVYSCTSCPLKFSKQTALAGHRNLHKIEYAPLLNGKIQHQKRQLSTRHTLFLRPLLLHVDLCPWDPFGYPHKQPERGSSPWYPLADTANMLKHMSSCNSLAKSKDVLPGPSSMPPLANPAYTLKHPSGLAPRCVGANPTETLIGGPTHGAPHNSFFDPEETLIGGATRGAPDNSFFDPEETLIGGPTRGAPHNSFFDPEEYESMIHKAWDQYRRLGHTDVPLKDALAEIGLKQVMEVKIRVGANNSIVDLINLLTATGSSSSLESQAGSSSDAHEDLSHGGKGTRSLFPVTPAQGIHNHHSVQPSQGLVQQVDNHEEGADLDLKL